MDLKLKHLLGSVNVSQEICIANIDSGEKFYPTYHELQGYNEYYVIDIYAYDENRLVVEVKQNI